MRYTKLILRNGLIHDLGKYDDDFVQCDVERGMGYSYNGDDDDEGTSWLWRQILQLLVLIL
jgi:hypothetical protein